MEDNATRAVRRMLDGSIGPGAQIRMCEFIARNPRYKKSKGED
jgi:hypothetical protein